MFRNYYIIIYIIIEIGDNGEAGAGGGGGVVVSIQRYKNVSYNDLHYPSNIIYGAPLVESGSSGGTVEGSEGENGGDGSNTEGIEYPDSVEFTNATISINKYKYNVRENLPKNIRERDLRKFLEDFENHEIVQTFYDIFGFADELQDIGDQYYHLRNQLSFIPFIESLQNRIGEHVKSDIESSEKKIAFKFLYTTVLSKLCAISNHENRVSVINLLEHLESVQENIDNLRDSIKDSIIHEYQDKYKRSLNKKIKLVNEFIRIQIKSKLESILIETEVQISSLIDEIINQERKSYIQYDDLSDKRRNIENIMRLHVMLNTAEVIDLSLEFFGSIAAVLVEVIGGTISIADTFYNSIEIRRLMMNEKNRIFRLIETVNSLIIVLRDRFLTKHKYFLKQLNDIENELNITFNDWMQPIRKEIVKLKVILNTDLLNEAIPDPTNIESMRSNLRIILQESKPSSHSDKELLEHLKNILTISNISMQVYDQIRDNKTKIEEVTRTITSILSVSGRYTQWEDGEGKIYALTIPLIREIQKGVKSMNDTINDKPHIELNIPKNVVQNLLREVKMILTNITVFTLLPNKLESSAVELNEGLALLIDVFDRIDSYSDKAKFTAYYLHSMSSYESNDTINNLQLTNVISTLKENIRTNLILDQYEEMTQALRQYQFPFGNLYVEIFELPTDLRFNDSDILIRKIEDYMANLKERINYSNLPFGEHDQQVFVNSFSSFSESFYKWNEYNIQSDIEKLLHGDEIIIKADITKGLDINALRFNEIELQLVLADKSKQIEFDNILEKLHMRMTIAGNNYLRCDSRFYYISLDDEIVIEYSLKKDSNGKPTRTNDMYRKITDRFFFFSPYIMWKIQLITDSSDSLNIPESLNELIKFNNIAIDLMLTGRGQYYKNQEIHSFGICNKQLDEFYRFDDTISILNSYLFKHRYFS